MSNPTQPTAAELIRLVRQHLESLQAAGVEWLPLAPTAPAAAPAAVRTATTAAVAVSGPSLFADPSSPAGTDPAGGLTVEQRRQELHVLAQRVATCPRCTELFSTRTQTVFGDGPVGAELCFIGEAPGGEEDAQGKPFVGPAGQLLNKIISACGLKREEIYICNILKCRPPNNRTPRADEVGHCREYLDRQLDLVKPKFICALGGCAAQNLLSTTQSLGKLRGRFHDYRGIPVLCTYHPAFLLPHRSPAKKKDVWEDMKLLMARLGRPIPR